MIAIIGVSITKGEITTSDHLSDLVKTEFQNPLPAERAQNVSHYIGAMADSIAYTCSPRPASEAYFLWIGLREFEVVVETFHQGNLLRSSESIVRALKRRLRQVDMGAEFEIRLQAVGDDQVYVSGTPNSILLHLWNGLQENLVAMGIGLVLVIIAKIWLASYMEEAIATFVSLVLFSGWQGLRIWLKKRRKPVDWSLHE